MVDVPWPLTNNPGLKPQEGTGKLVNVFVEPQSNGQNVWRRAPGAIVFSRTPSSGSIEIEFDINAVGATMFSSFFEFVGVSTARESGSTFDINAPTNQVGDLIVLACGAPVQTTAWQVPNGFTQLVASTTPSFSSYGLFYRISTGDTTYQILHPSTGHATATAVSIRGAMSTAPICDTGTVSTGAAGDPDPSDVTLTTASGLAIAVGWHATASSTQTAPTTFGNLVTSRTSNDTFRVMMAFSPQPTTGSVVVSSFNTNGSGEWAAYSFTVRHL